MSVVNVAIHESQSPERVQLDLWQSLCLRNVNHKFHYDSVKQTAKWLALHSAYSPSRTDPDCAAIYDRSFEAATRLVESDRVHLIGLGCGGGQKDTRLLHLLSHAGKEIYYSPVDVSVAMVLVARQAALSVVPAKHCFPLVCDLATAVDLKQDLQPAATPAIARLFSFFAMIPNFEPGWILPRLAELVDPGDLLLFSANLAPGQDYSEGTRRILPLYDNELTRDWLMTFLLDLGVEKSDGELQFRIEPDPLGARLLRVAAYYKFAGSREIRVGARTVEFKPGNEVRLFFSYRYTPELIRSLLATHRLNVKDQWIAASEEEGVFLVRSERV
jgi:uncharacterized SAM-dependent methyltransferase